MAGVTLPCAEPFIWVVMRLCRKGCWRHERRQIGHTWMIDDVCTRRGFWNRVVSEEEGEDKRKVRRTGEELISTAGTQDKILFGRLFASTFTFLHTAVVV